MIVKEYYTTREDDVKLYRTYSDQGFLIMQIETGIQYDEAIDVENAAYTYAETGILPENKAIYSILIDSDDVTL